MTNNDQHDKTSAEQIDDSVPERKDDTGVATDDADIKSCDRSREEDCSAPLAEEDVGSQVTVLEQKVAELKDMYIRAQAEMQNKDRRNIEEIKKARDYAISSFATDLVVVKDYLEMALKDQSGNFEMLKMGVDLTLKQLVQVFEGHKIKTIEPKVGDKLDPHSHQAMNTVEAEGQEPNTVVSIMQKGYSLNERVLRPAMVTVSK